MTPLRPYLLRAVYEWALENGFTPHVLIDAAATGVSVPETYVRDGRITLNVHPQAVQALEMGNDSLRFSARFGGRPMEVEAPIMAVLAIFAKENGRGIVFQEEPPPGPPDDNPPGDKGDKSDKTDKKPPFLKVVK